MVRRCLREAQLLIRKKKKKTKAFSKYSAEQNVLFRSLTSYLVIPKSKGFFLSAQANTTLFCILKTQSIL
ncbi:hypothetical protein DPMN_170132 [Dreissena polymorpha]|uniref:Uncharacterized protein n=1 Tax=Dreissena polymorpha TaxID=45954 RepID=A0A9D4DYR0_DREPO|nr:hypothetical protein DPMN_170132 [Dreissena polymorpha]